MGRWGDGEMGKSGDWEKGSARGRYWTTHIRIVWQSQSNDQMAMIDINDNTNVIVGARWPGLHN